MAELVCLSAEVLQMKGEGLKCVRLLQQRRRAAQKAGKTATMVDITQAVRNSTIPAELLPYVDWATLRNSITSVSPSCWIDFDIPGYWPFAAYFERCSDGWKQSALPWGHPPPIDATMRARAWYRIVKSGGEIRDVVYCVSLGATLAVADLDYSEEGIKP